MPYKFETDKVRLPEGKDRRVKLSTRDKIDVMADYGTMSQRQCAAKWGVSRRTIVFIWHPEKLEQKLLRRKERGGYNYSKEVLAGVMREHRDYKKKVLKEFIK